MLVIILNGGKEVVFDRMTRYMVSFYGNLEDGKLERLTVYKDETVIGDFKGSAVEGYYLTAYTTEKEDMIEEDINKEE